MASHSRVLVYHGPENKLPPTLGVAPRLLKSHPPLHRKLTATLPVKNAGQNEMICFLSFPFQMFKPCLSGAKKNPTFVSPRESRKAAKTPA